MIARLLLLSILFPLILSCFRFENSVPKTLSKQDWTRFSSGSLTTGQYPNFQIGHEAAIAYVEADSVGVSVVGYYPGCYLKPVAIQLWYRRTPHDNFEYQDECRIGRQDGDSAYMRGYCQFREPIPEGASASQVLVRAFNLSADCETYGHEDSEGFRFAFVDRYPSNPVQRSVTYKAFAENRLVTVEKEAYKLVMERNTGTTYELYSKRAKIGSTPTRVNSVHSHQGAAIQVAIHDIDESSQSTSPEQLYWNPTQGGALCAYPRSQNVCGDPAFPSGSDAPAVLCDWQNKSDCTSAKSVTFSPFRMMSYAYDPSYPGPYNTLDTMTFTQDVRAENHFIEYSIQFRDIGKQRNVRLEIPTYYFTNPYRKFYFQQTGSSLVRSSEVPKLRTATKNYGFLQDERTDLNWITFENAGSAQDDAFTIAWIYGPELRDDIQIYEYWVGTDDAFNNVKFSNFPYLRTRSNVNYQAKYIIFPYRFDEVITTRYGTLSVADTISAWKAEGGKVYAGVIQPEGLFLLKYGAGDSDVGIYYSNGMTSVCGFRNGDSFFRFAGPLNPVNFPRRTSLPSGMRNDGACPDVEPAGYFLLKYGAGEHDCSIYKSDGSTGYCYYSDFNKYLASGGNPDPFVYPKRWALPESMTSQGECR